MTPRPRPIALAAVAVAAVVLSGALSAQQTTTPRQRTIAVSVLDRSDKPLTEFAAADFVVREDGRSREVLGVAPAPPPANIVLLVDDSQATSTFTRDLRQALTGFVDRLADAEPAPAVRLTTTGARPTVRVDFTPSFSAVSLAIDRLIPATGSGATFLEALIETTRDLRTKKIEGAVIVAFVAESGPEFSTMSAREVETALQAVRASLWTVVLQEPNVAAVDSERRERAAVTGDVTAKSGGRNRPVLSPQQLPAAFGALADILLSRIAITYGRPESLVPPNRLEVTGRDRSWRVQVSRWPER
jgi:hypothetical protein